MYKFDFARERAVLIGDSFGPVPSNFIRTGFTWTGTVVKFMIFRRDLDAPIFTKVIPWTNVDPDTLDFNLHMTPEETADIRTGEYKYSVLIEWPNGTDKNTIFGGLIQFKNL